MNSDSPPVPDDPFVTEDYLRYQVERKVSGLIADYLAVVYAENPAGAYRIGNKIHAKGHEYQLAPERSPKIQPPLETRLLGYRQVRLARSTTPPAATSSRTDVHQLPGGGTEQTGEFTTVDNTQGTEPITHEIEKSATEESSSEVSFSESVELSNKTTIEAGTDTAKVSDELTETFGFSKEDVEGKSSSTTVTVRDSLVIPAGQKSVIVFTDNASGGRLNDVDIAALGTDWTQIEWSGDDEFWRSSSGRTWVDVHPGHQPWTRRSAGGRQWLSFVHGYDLRALHAAELLTPRYADRHQLARVATMAEHAVRQIAWEGTRRTADRSKDASYKVIDATGVDRR